MTTVTNKIFTNYLQVFWKSASINQLDTAVPAQGHTIMIVGSIPAAFAYTYTRIYTRNNTESLLDIRPRIRNALSDCLRDELVTGHHLDREFKHLASRGNFPK